MYIVALCLIFITVAVTGEWTITDWTVVGRPAPGHLVKLTFAIRQHNAEWLRDKLKAVSYPDSSEYTNYMNFDEIAQYVYGEPESVHTVTDVLKSMGAQKMDFTIGRDFIIAHVPFEATETLFQAYFLELEHKEFSGLRVVSSLYYTVPPNLKKHIDFVAGFVLSPTIPSKPYKIKPQQERGSLRVDPNTIADKYNTSKYTSTNPNNSQAVAAFGDVYFNPSDLTTFQERYQLLIKPVAKIVGKNDESNPGTEGSLDLEYIFSTGRNVSTWYISTPITEGFLYWIIGQVNTTDSPWVHSVSYDDVGAADPNTANRIDKEFMKFGISGRSVLFASGDGGVNCAPDGKFTPEWPASSPYVTSVGGTTNLTSVWTFGGGGFSDLFPTPDYQKEAVESYLNSGKAPNEKLFNKSGRAYPDVSAFSTNFQIICGGKTMLVNGTSCSTPTFAGLVASLNDVRLNKGLKTLGFLNPLLYTKLKGQGFFDVTEGQNGGSNCKGFEAIAGWDPASGWGNPNFGLLKNLV